LQDKAYWISNKT